MNKRFVNEFFTINADITNLGLVNRNEPLTVTCKIGDEDSTFKINNEDYPIVNVKNGEFIVDENILANEIIQMLYESGKIAPAMNTGDIGKYLVEKAKDKNYYYEDGILYNLYDLKDYRIGILDKFIDTLDDEYLKNVNLTLRSVLSDLPVYDCKCLVKNDIHFEASEDNKDFGKAEPRYNCNKRKVSGIIKHVKNSMAKRNILDINNAKEFLTILKRKTKDAFTFEDKKKESFIKLTNNETNSQFDLIIVDGIVNIFGEGNISKTFRFSQMEEILEFISN